jgi:ribosome-associated heat shock protein Hsp15
MSAFASFEWVVGTHRIDSRELFVMSREIYTRNASVRYHRFDAACEGIRMSEGPNSGPSARLDVWLDVTCLFRTRSEAQKAIGNGKITVNGQPAKAHRMLREGDQVVIGRPFGRRQTIMVKGIAEKHVSKTDARLLYEDLTPPPTAEEIEQRRLERMYRAAVTPPTTPDKRARRALRQMKEGE